MMILLSKTLSTIAFSDLRRFCRSVRSAESGNKGSMGETAARVRFGVDLTSGIDALAPILTLVILDGVCERY